MACFEESLVVGNFKNVQLKITAKNYSNFESL